MLLALAAYNAGPAAIARARKKTKKMGLDPNIWFSNVELGAGRAIGQEPVTYVRNIFKYAISVRLTGGYETVAEVAELVPAAKPPEEVERAASTSKLPPGLVGRPAWQLWTFGLLLAIGLIAIAVYVVRVRQSQPRQPSHGDRPDGRRTEGPYPGRYGPSRRTP